MPCTNREGKIKYGKKKGSCYGAFFSHYSHQIPTNINLYTQNTEIPSDCSSPIKTKQQTNKMIKEAKRKNKIKIRKKQPRNA